MRWPTVRAALLALHVVAIIVVSFPGSYKLSDRARWKRKRSQDEFALWAERLRGWGWPITTEEVELKLWSLAQGYLAVRNTVAYPFEPYIFYSGALQTWGMFTAPTRQPYLLKIQILESDAWREIQFSELDNNRFRKQIGRLGRDAVLFDHMSRWLGRRAIEDHPQAAAVRVVVHQFDTLPPERIVAGEVITLRIARQRNFSAEQLR